MAVIQIKKYKYKKDENGKYILNENGEKKKFPKTKEEWNKETCNGTKTWYFYDRYVLNGKQKPYHSSMFVLKREAEEEERLFLNEPIKYIQEHSKKAKNNQDILKISNNKEKKTLNEYFKDFNEYKLMYIKGASVYEDKKNWDGHISEELGEYSPEELTFEIIQEWHENTNKAIKDKKNKELYSTRSKNKWHSTLSEFLEYLKSNKKIEVNYAKAIGQFRNLKENKNKKKKIKFQTLEQYEFFMKEIDDEFWHIFFNFTFWHGCRIGEQRALRIKDIDFENNTVHFRETYTKDENGKEVLGPIKNNRERIIYLAKESKPYLLKLVELYKNMDCYSEEWFLFGGPQNTYKNRIERKINAYYKELIEKYPDNNINPLTHHEFGRHSHASYMLEQGLKKGMNIDEIYAAIAQRIGDTIEVVKSTYAHPYEDENFKKTQIILN